MEILDVPVQQDNSDLLDDDIYANGNDKQLHLRAVLAIADEIDRPIEEIADLYEDVLKHMQARASISDYLPILVSKRVKQVFASR
jgi:hypothetical protein